MDGQTRSIAGSPPLRGEHPEAESGPQCGYGSPPLRGEHEDMLQTEAHVDGSPPLRGEHADDTGGSAFIVGSPPLRGEHPTIRVMVLYQPQDFVFSKDETHRSLPILESAGLTFGH